MSIKSIGYAFLLSAIIAQYVFISFVPQVAWAEEASMSEEILLYLTITSVQITGGTGKTSEDFIELFNPTNVPFDLNGHRLVKRTATGSTDTVIKAWTEQTIVPAFHFYLWANGNYSAISISPDIMSSGTLADNNGIALRFGGNDTGEIIDSLAWGSTVNIFENQSSENPGANESLVLDNVFSETSTYSINPSSPRNSFIEQLPLTNEDDIPVEDLPADEEEEVEQEEDVSEEELEDPDVDTGGEVENGEEQSEDKPIKLIITELLPNPSGSDSGSEKIELYNIGDESVNLTGYKLDDTDSKQIPSNNVLVLQNLEIEPNSYEVISIPSGYFSLNNTGGDFITLYNADNENLDTVYYESSSPENKSFSLFNDDEWFWAESTFGKDNGNPPNDEDEESEDEKDIETIEKVSYDSSRLVITEIFPLPDTGTNEFIEILNDGSKVALLSQVELFVGERKKVLPEFKLEPGKYFTINHSSLPIQLRNSGQTITLKFNQSVISTVTYPAAIQGSSFAKFEDGFLWTTHTTSGKENILVIPEIVKKGVEAKAGSIPKPKIQKTTASTVKKSSAAAKPQANKVINKPEAGLTKTDKPKEQEVIENETVESTEKAPLGKIIAIGAAAVSAGLIALYKLVFTEGAE